MAVLIETSDLVQTVIASAVAGIGVTVAFSLAIWGAARFVELSRDERRAAATAALALSGLALAVTLAAVVAGIVVMTSK